MLVVLVVTKLALRQLLTSEGMSGVVEGRAGTYVASSAPVVLMLIVP
jgi:hypothetical protein